MWLNPQLLRFGHIYLRNPWLKTSFFVQCKWKMLFNPYQSKPTHEISFSRKYLPCNQQDIYFDIFKVKKRNIKNTLRIVLDEKLIFKYHIEKLIYKVNKGVSVIRKRATFLLESLSLPFTMFFCLDYGDKKWKI